METAFVAEWVKAFHYRGEPPSIYYWRSSDGLEVDLLVDRNGKLHAFEVRATATVTPAHASGLRRWQTLAAAEARGTAAIVADVHSSFFLAEGIRVVPWWTM